MTMFHLVFPRRRGFLHWDELGCVARSLGFQEDVFQQNINYEINDDEDGLKLKEIVKMLDLKLLYRPLHRTFNMHTAGWNMAVIRKAIKLLDHHALTFEELHNIRVSYEMYEAIDMKGLYLDQHILLRAIKMCGRFIAPMKLMHRIKHMKGSFDESGRIQLYEFLDLIMWCDFYQRFNPAEMEYSEGMDQELFKLVDFERLLSHHDERVARQLNQQYLQEEWDFGKETLGSKSMFRDPPVNNDQRLRQTKFHRERYRHLKEQVGHSQRRVFQALAGYVRQRPISAPDLSMYCRTGGSDVTTPTTAKQVYQSVQRRLKSAPSMNATTSALDLTDRPPTRQYTRVSTPVAVSAMEKTEIDQKMEHLNFAITTLESRMEIHKEREMQIYIPHYLEKLANRPPPAVEIIDNMEPEPEPAPKPKKQGLSEEAVKRLAYPPPRLPPSHARKCDARFRGWYDVRKKAGSHYVLVANTLEPSPVGSQLIKMRERLAKEVPQHHSDYVYRYTRKREISASSRPSSMGLSRDSRPITAPAAVELGVEPLDLAEAAEEGDEGEGECLQPGQNGGLVPESAGVSSRAEVHMQRSESTTVDHLMKMTNLFEAQLAGGGGATNLLPENISSDSRQVSLEREVAFGLEPLSVSTPMAKKQEQKVQGGEEDKPSLKEREPSVVDLYLPVPVSAQTPGTAASTNGTSSSSSSSKPKKIEMGQIGTITLLESIKEAEADEELSYTSTELSSEQESEPKVSRLGQLARDSVNGSPEGRPQEDFESEETETGTETTSTARVTSAERRSILVRREAANTPYGYRPPRSPSPGKERRNVKYDENSLKKEVMTSDVPEGTSQSDSRTFSSPESPQRKPAAQQQTQQQQQQQQQQSQKQQQQQTQKQQQQQTQKQQQQQQQQQQQTQKQPQQQQQQQSSSESTSPPKAKPEGDPGSPDSKISRGWDSPVKQTSPSTKASKTSEPYNFPKEANFPLDSVHLGKKASAAETSPKDTAGPQTSARVSGESRTPESGRKAEEKKKVLSPRNAVVQNGRSQERTSSASVVSGTRLEVDFATPKPTPRLSPRGGQKAKKAKSQAPKYGKFVKRYEKDLPPYLKNRLLTAGTS